MHLPQREQVLDLLVALLKPGGWLLLEEGDLFPWRAWELAATPRRGPGSSRPSGRPESTAAGHGGSRSTCVARGIEHVQADCDVPLVEGGTPEAELFVLTATQIRDAVLAAGTTLEQLAVFEVELTTPGRWLPAFALMTASGRKRA